MNKVIPFSSCYLILTEDCNLRCKYCYESTNRCSNNYMSFDTAKKAADLSFDNALKFGMKKLSWIFFGGEPLLNLDVMIKFFHYVRDKAKENNIKLNFSITTNGTIYNKEFEEFILEWYKATKQVSIIISIDGIPEVQDKNRATVNGKPTSGIILENILKLKKFFEKNQIKFSSLRTHSVVTKDTVSNLFSSYKYLKELGINETRFEISHEEDWNENDISTYTEQLSLISDYVYNECIMSALLDPYRNMGTLFGEIGKKTCEAGKLLCAIAPNGDIYPCTRAYFSSRNLILGNVHNGFIDNNKRKLFFDSFRDNMHVGNISCGKCDNSVCKICKIYNYEKYNDFLKCNPLVCSMYKAKSNFVIETKKKFNKLTYKLDYKKCNEMTFFNTRNL
ncbi:MAG: radical SAM protein [Ignavibacteriales bacterium]